MQSDTNGGERFIAAYVCRETPWWFAIKEVVADLRGIYYVRTVDVGHKREMEASYKDLYGKEWHDLPPLDDQALRARRTRVPSGRAQAAQQWDGGA